MAEKRSLCIPMTWVWNTKKTRIFYSGRERHCREGHEKASTIQSCHLDCDLNFHSCHLVDLKILSCQEEEHISDNVQIKFMTMLFCREAIFFQSRPSWEYLCRFWEASCQFAEGVKEGLGVSEHAQSQACWGFLGFAQEPAAKVKRQHPFGLQPLLPGAL